MENCEVDKYAHTTVSLPIRIRRSATWTNTQTVYEHSTDADAHTYAHTLTSMNACTHASYPYEHLRETESTHYLEIDEVVTDASYPYEHLRETESTHYLEIDEVVTDAFVVDGTSPPIKRLSLEGLE
jgi:hypothetical protein